MLAQDFYQMLVHHITTVALLSFAYIGNMLPIGVLIALVHDVSDVPLEVWSQCVCAVMLSVYLLSSLSWLNCSIMLHMRDWPIVLLLSLQLCL